MCWTRSGPRIWPVSQEVEARSSPLAGGRVRRGGVAGGCRSSATSFGFRDRRFEGLETPAPPMTNRIWRNGHPRTTRVGRPPVTRGRGHAGRGDLMASRPLFAVFFWIFLGRRKLLQFYRQRVSAGACMWLVYAGGSADAPEGIGAMEKVLDHESMLRKLLKRKRRPQDSPHGSGYQPSNQDDEPLPSKDFNDQPTSAVSGSMGGRVVKEAVQTAWRQSGTRGNWGAAGG